MGEIDDDENVDENRYPLPLVTPTRPTASSPLKRDSAESAEPSSSSRGADANERRLRRRKLQFPRGVLSQQSIRKGLIFLMECKAPDGRYLVTRKVHWQAVYRVLVDEGWFDASLGYAAFVEYIRSVAPPDGFRIMPDVETIRHISQTLYARPFAKWRYDTAYHTKRWAYERMRAVAEALLGVMGEEK